MQSQLKAVRHLLFHLFSIGWCYTQFLFFVFFLNLVVQNCEKHCFISGSQTSLQIWAYDPGGTVLQTEGSLPRWSFSPGFWPFDVPLFYYIIFLAFSVVHNRNFAPNYTVCWGFLGGSVGKEFACNIGDTGDMGWEDPPW